MSFWWFRIWRVAVQRPGDPVLALVGDVTAETAHWRRVWWLLWWGTTRHPVGRPPAPVEAGAEEGQATLHWMQPHTRQTMCGQQGSALRWTIEWDYVSCPKCRDEGALVRMHYVVSTR